jgi:hypothetical protein
MHQAPTSTQDAGNAALHIEALQKEIDSLEFKLLRAEEHAKALDEQLEEAHEHASTKSQAADLYFELIQSIQAQIAGASRPGSAASGGGGAAGALGGGRMVVTADDQAVVRGALEQLRQSQQFAAGAQFDRLCRDPPPPRSLLATASPGV